MSVKISLVWKKMSDSKNLHNKPRSCNNKNTVTLKMLLNNCL